MSINVNSTQINALLQLYPMAIPGAEENLQPPGAYHLGIPESIHSPSTKLFMVIDPITLFSTLFAAGDSVRLWVNGQATSVIKPIKPGEENDRIFMELPWGGLKDGRNTLYYEVTRVSGSKDKSDPILNVLFNNPASGITVSHPASIGPGQPATITLTRSYPREYDVVKLTVGTWSKTIAYVHPANPITYTLTTADLQQIGDGTHPVSATVVDQLSNRKLSPTTSISITANQKVYNPPIIVQGEPDKILDVTALNGKNATIHGQIWTGIEVGQQVWLKLTGQKPDGSTVTLRIWNGGASQVNATWVRQGFWPKPLPASFLSQLADGFGLLMEFWVSEDKSNNFATATKFADQVYMIKAVQQVLNPPIILEAEANKKVLDVTLLNGKNATLHALTWSGMVDGQPCWLKLLGFKVDGSAHDLQLWNGLPARTNPTWISSGKYVQNVLNSYLAQLADGKSLTVQFWVSMDKSNDFATATKFPDQVYTVSRRVLHRPIILDAEANGGVLDVAALAGKDATLHALTWSGMVAGQPCWLKLLGFKTDGSAHDLQLWNGLPAQTNPTWISQGKYVQNVLNSYLAQLGDRKSLTVQFWVSEDKSNNFATATKFPDQVYTVKAVALIAPTIGSVNENTATGKLVAKGGSTTANTLVISGKLSPDQRGELYDGSGATAKPLGKVTANAAGNYSITITVAKGAHRFYIQSLYHPGTVYSNVWTLTVVARLVIDQTLMVLNAVKFIQRYGWSSKEVPGNTAARTPTEGIPPYFYQSDNSAVASVTSGGKVSGLKSGSANIQVSDQSGEKVSYPVQVSNVFELIQTRPVFPGKEGNVAAQEWVKNQGGVTPAVNILTLPNLEANFTHVLRDVFGNIDVENGGIYMVSYGIPITLGFGWQIGFYSLIDDLYSSLGWSNQFTLGAIAVVPK
ncbi:Ig-like domain-containing protein [Pseudomonas atagonensis]|uniref:Ig-like domain-containing protein n=1 Tax=Pseudomonas atagonensis TaxID=2609964 RepID=UPI00140ABA3A|nr:Ig-like domain-containing protein [Pseudomonas atagonensis]